MPAFDAIVLTGGRSRRMGTPKQQLAYAGNTLLRRALAACAEARSVVVAGPPEAAEANVRFAPEDPPFGGPVAGIFAGLTMLAADGDGPADWVLVLAVDHPELPSAVPRLLAALPRLGADIDTLLVEHAGEAQILLGAHRTAALRKAFDRLGQTRDTSVRRLQQGLHRELVTVAGVDLSDVDEPADAERFGIAVPGSAAVPEGDQLGP